MPCVSISNQQSITWRQWFRLPITMSAMTENELNAIFKYEDWLFVGCFVYFYLYHRSCDGKRIRFQSLRMMLSHFHCCPINKYWYVLLSFVLTYFDNVRPNDDKSNGSQFVSFHVQIAELIGATKEFRAPERTMPFVGDCKGLFWQKCN